MRSRYEEDDDDDDRLDQPVTVTGRQLRSLKRGAQLGLFGLILGVAATGLAAWSLFANRPHEPTVAAAPASTEESMPPDSSLTQAMPSTGATATPPAASPTTPPPAATTTVKPTATATRTTTRKRSATSATTEKPVTVPGTSLSPDLPSTPIAIPSDAGTKPAARDTSGSR